MEVWDETENLQRLYLWRPLPYSCDAYPFCLVKRKGGADSCSPEGKIICFENAGTRENLYSFGHWSVKLRLIYIMYIPSRGYIM